jgi:predicted TIM-barrel fold metal-dependent hydrolase
MIPYKIVSSDDHMIETASLWEERVPKRFGERAPRLVKDPPGKKGLFFSCGDSSMGLSMAFCAGKTVDKNFLEAGLEAAPPAGWDPAARLKDMDTDNLEAALLYTTSGMCIFSGLNEQDAELQEASFRAYNDWLAEYCSYAPKRLYGIAMISLYNIDHAVKELERCRKQGHRGAMIWATPPEDRPWKSPAYEPFWRAAEELDMPLSLHLGTGTTKENRAEGDVAQRYVRLVVRTRDIHYTILELIFNGILERHPKLKLVSAEADISWVPHILERAEKYHRFFSPVMGGLPMKPTEYFDRQVYFTWIDDPVGVKMYKYCGKVDNLMWSTDYPHRTSTWPHSVEYVEKEFEGMPDSDKRKLLRDNVIKCYGLEIQP